MENFNFMKERHKIKIKDLKSFNTLIYISHHKKKREEGSKSDSFLRSNTPIFFPIRYSFKQIIHLHL